MAQRSDQDASVWDLHDEARDPCLPTRVSQPMSAPARDEREEMCSVLRTVDGGHRLGRSEDCKGRQCCASLPCVTCAEEKNGK